MNRLQLVLDLLIARLGVLFDKSRTIICSIQTASSAQLLLRSSAIVLGIYGVLAAVPLCLMFVQNAQGLGFKENIKQKAPKKYLCVKQKSNGSRTGNSNIQNLTRIQYSGFLPVLVSQMP